MRLFDLDTLADRLVDRSRTSELTSEHVVQLRDAILFNAVLDILDSLGGTLGQLRGRRLREQLGDGTGLRAPNAGQYLDTNIMSLTRQASAVFPPHHYTLQVMYATRSVEALVRTVAGADEDYAPPAGLLDLLCLVTALAIRPPGGPEFEAGQQIVRRVWAEVGAAGQSLPAY